MPPSPQKEESCSFSRVESIYTQKNTTGRRGRGAWADGESAPVGCTCCLSDLATPLELIAQPRRSGGKQAILTFQREPHKGLGSPEEMPAQPGGERLGSQGRSSPRSAQNGKQESACAEVPTGTPGRRWGRSKSVGGLERLGAGA